MHKFRFYFRELGGHTHVRVFAGPSDSITLGKCGDLVFKNEEWAAFVAVVEAGRNVPWRAQILPETEK